MRTSQCQAWMHWLTMLAVVVGPIASGCRSKPEVVFEASDASFPSFMTDIEYPDAQIKTVSAEEEIAAPHTLREPDPKDYWPLTLQEVTQLAMANSETMRSIGARVVAAPQATGTVYDVAMQETDPRSGVEAALSEFDTQFTTGLFFDRDERAFNNAFIGGGATSLHRNTGAFQAELSKQTAAGTALSVRNITNYDRNNSPVNLFRSTYETLFEAEFRHPLLQGSGIGFNRIAGPNGRPGSYNGVMIARIRTDIALADFEAAVRDFLQDVERTYWSLYFAYRNLDARIAARDAALESWRTAKAQLDAGAGDILDESLAREQYYQFETLVANALSGASTDTSISSTGPGVYALERQLRFLIGVDINDGRLIRPADEPARAELLFDWNDSINEAMARRVELRRQRWNIKQRELELLAARNMLLMRLDLVGLYRWRGFGDALLGNRSVENGSAFRDLFTGDLQGWQLGLQLSTPVGNRIAHTAVRNAELALRRDRVLLEEQERGVSKELSDAFAELDRAYRLARMNFNRSVAARSRLRGEMDKYEIGQGLLQFVFDAQSRVADADSEFFRSLVDYNLAAAKVHYARGTFLDYMGVHLSEGAWSEEAYRSAAKESRRFAPRKLNYCVTQPCPVSDGDFPQQVLPRDEVEVEP